MKQYWKCSFYYKTKCPAIVIVDDGIDCYETQHEHQHDPDLMPVKGGGATVPHAFDTLSTE